ncbi:Na+/alanine symporter [Dermatophilus congolensis]|uniref:Na+/alanine symporter n=1 Tax=Dermatophilus congolensis TaxID=1863 RepID=A0AA46H1D7_9MICO|nr:alanine/glycine:cation symporter family protein [Dermatophilus congolensis]STD14766.1 Na+/alanine symporter [Dermatophilus congolensis]
MIDALTAYLGALNGFVYTYFLVALLIGGGLYFTLRTRAVQIRHFHHLLSHSLASRKGANGGISSFQAFAMGMATRIGIGNITGVALALVLGGPGAIFWMWVIAAVGMATSFFEATLAQVFKVSNTDGTYRGGTAYYLSYGLQSRAWGVGIASALVFCMVIAMPMVQGNTIALALENAHGIPAWATGLLLMALTALVVFAGMRGVARTTEILSPMMAIGYVCIAVTVVIMNIGSVPRFLSDIISGAFGIRPGLAGVAGGVTAAVLNGAQRGLFTNEAGMATNPNAAATATVAHPVQQGFIQSLGVLVDSMIICTATAFIILSSGSGVYVPGVVPAASEAENAAASLTVNAVTSQLGSWAVWPMSIMIFFFGFSSILGAYAYASVNVDFLRGYNTRNRLAATLVVLTTGVGSVLALKTVWALMDTAMALTTLINIIGLIALSKWVVGALRDYEAQKAAGIDEPRFCGEGNSNLPRDIPTDVWK